MLFRQNKLTKKRIITDTFGDKIFLHINTIVLFIAFIIFLLPLLNVLSFSLSSPSAATSGRVWIVPVEPSLDAYKSVFRTRAIPVGFYNSFFYTTFGTLINVALTIMVAYPLSRRDFYGKELILFAFVITMLFSGGIVPTYLVVKGLGLLDTRWAMLLPGALAVYNVIIARSFLQTTIPGDLYDAAELDGCSDLMTLRIVVLPLSKAILAVLTLFYAVGHWNTYFSALIYLRSRELFPLQLILRDYLYSEFLDEIMGASISSQFEKMARREVVKYALIIVATLPVIVIYPFVQKHFTRGVMIGSLKG